MDIQNTQSQMRKGVLEFCILSIIQQGEVYPSDIVEQMKAANLHILEGTLSTFNKIKKCRFTQLPLGGKYQWSTKKIFCDDGGRSKSL